MYSAFAGIRRRTARSPSPSGRPGAAVSLMARNLPRIPQTPEAKPADFCRSGRARSGRFRLPTLAQENLTRHAGGEPDRDRAPRAGPDDTEHRRPARPQRVRDNSHQIVRATHDAAGEGHHDIAAHEHGLALELLLAVAPAQARPRRRPARRDAVYECAIADRNPEMARECGRQVLGLE